MARRRRKSGSYRRSTASRWRCSSKTLSGLAGKKENGERLLDRTMVFYGSSMGDANIHDNTNLPILLAGGGFRHGQHIAFKRDNNAPLCNLFVSMMQRMGVETDAFASSSGRLTGLEAGVIFEFLAFDNAFGPTHRRLHAVTRELLPTSLASQQLQQEDFNR